AEHVPAHIADAHHGEVLGLAVAAHLQEVPLGRLPGPAGGDAHGLVVVPGRAAGGEGIIEPVVVLGRDGIGQVGEGSGALIGRDHQVRVVAVVPDHLLWWAHLFAGPVVGDVQHAPDEFGVGGLALVHPRLPVRGGI